MSSRSEYLPSAVAAVALVVVAVVFACELVRFRGAVTAWALSDLQSRADLAARNLEEPLRTQDFPRLREFGRSCEADGVRLKVTQAARGGRVYDTRTPGPSEPSMFWRESRSGEYLIAVGLAADRVLAPFRRAWLGFVLAGLVGVAGVLLFFFVTYRQRVRIRELRRLEEFRRTFVADVSHEIKTPLTGILGAADLLADADGLPRESLAELVGMIRREGVRLNSLVGEILSLARLEQDGGAALAKAPSDVAAIAAETVERLGPAAAAAGLRLASSGAGPCAADCDAELVRRALANLVLNAIRHSGGRTVDVTCAPRPGGGVRIAVTDDGVGIPPEHRERVFERFHRVDPSRSGRTGGSGLGLAIARRIARLHGGDLTLEPVSPSGCRFVLDI